MTRGFDIEGILVMMHFLYQYFIHKLLAKQGSRFFLDQYLNTFLVFDT